MWKIILKYENELFEASGIRCISYFVGSNTNEHCVLFLLVSIEELHKAQINEYYSVPTNLAQQEEFKNHAFSSWVFSNFLTAYSKSKVSFGKYKFSSFLNCPCFWINLSEMQRKPNMKLIIFTNFLFSQVRWDGVVYGSFHSYESIFTQILSLFKKN